MTRTEASSPERNSSMRTKPSVWIASLNASVASSLDDVTVTPFPPARTSLLMTHGRSNESKLDSIASISSILSNLPVGIPSDCITTFACVFEPSSKAPSECGPKLGIDSCLSLSDSPFTRGASGPTTTNETPRSLARLTIPSMSESGTLWLVATIDVPALPGVQCTERTESLLERPIANACSLPPEPTTSTSIPVMFHSSNFLI